MGDGGVLVLDLGTTSLKAALIAAEGGAHALAERDYGEAPGPHRQDPDAWWRAACAAVAALGPIHPAAIAFSGTMENLIPVSAEGMPAGPAILYSDPCGEPFCAAGRKRLEAVGAAGILGNSPEPLMTAFKLMWLAEAEPEVLAAARWVLLSPKDALILRLTGRAVTDPTTATTSGLMDLSLRRWSPPLLDALGIDGKCLPQILPADAQVGTLMAEPATELGLAPGLPVVNGCGDCGANTLGARCSGIGDVGIYLGTSGWVARVVSDAGLAAPRPCYRLAHPQPGRVIEVTPLMAAGGCAAWARRLFGLDVAAAEAAAEAADRRPPELVFLPYLGGERSPFVDLDVRGAFLGLDAGHGPGELYYAVLEGVAFAVAANLRALCGPGRTGPVRLSGGGAKSGVWPRLIADALTASVEVMPHPEFVTAAGAASLARRSLGAGEPPPHRQLFTMRRPGRKARAERLGKLFAEATRFAREVGPRLKGG